MRKPMSAETAEKGKEFVRALLGEGHEYESMKANFLSTVAKETHEVAKAKMQEKQAKRGPSGAITEAANMLGISRNYFSTLLDAAGG